MQLPLRTPQRTAEIAWFADLCGGDTEYLGTLDPVRRSHYAHCRNMVTRADGHGFNNILLPSSYMIGQDPFTFAGAVAPFTQNISLLAAHRFGELHPPMLARTISTLDHLLQGRLTLNVINSDLPGMQESGALRYQRTREIIEILQQAWTRERIEYKGELYQFDLPTDPVKPYQQNGGPLLYFGGFSPEARDVCAQYCDVFLMWPDTEEGLQASMRDVGQRAVRHGRTLDFGLRVHVVVRETEQEAVQYTHRLMSQLDDVQGERMKSRSQDAQNMGVQQQSQLRASADGEGYAEALLWTGIGRARSGCGAALVGTPDQIIGKINRYIEMGIRAFIFSGYPLLEECDAFARYVLPALPNEKLARLQNRLPTETPETPLTYAPLRLS